MFSEHICVKSKSISQWVLKIEKTSNLLSELHLWLKTFTFPRKLSLSLLPPCAQFGELMLLTYVEAQKFVKQWTIYLHRRMITYSSYTFCMCQFSCSPTAVVHPPDQSVPGQPPCDPPLIWSSLPIFDLPGQYYDDTWWFI